MEHMSGPHDIEHMPGANTLEDSRREHMPSSRR